MYVCVVQVVHSRTFGTAAKEGGTAVHMLLPLVDFLNHGGDETECFPGDPFAPTANVRWAVPFCSPSFLCPLLLLLLLFLLLNHPEHWGTNSALPWGPFGFWGIRALSALDVNQSINQRFYSRWGPACPFD